MAHTSYFDGQQHWAADGTTHTRTYTTHTPSATLHVHTTLHLHYISRTLPAFTAHPSTFGSHTTHYTHTHTRLRFGSRALPFRLHGSHRTPHIPTLPYTFYTGFPFPHTLLATRLPTLHRTRLVPHGLPLPRSSARCHHHLPTVRWLVTPHAHRTLHDLRTRTPPHTTTATLPPHGCCWWWSPPVRWVVPTPTHYTSHYTFRFPHGDPHPTTPHTHTPTLPPPHPTTHYTLVVFVVGEVLLHAPAYYLKRLPRRRAARTARCTAHTARTPPTHLTPPRCRLPRRACRAPRHRCYAPHCRRCTAPARLRAHLLPLRTTFARRTRTLALPHTTYRLPRYRSTGHHAFLASQHRRLCDGYFAARTT